MMTANSNSWIDTLCTREGENRTRMAVAFGLLLLLPWMLILTRAGAEICCALIGVLFLWRSAMMRDWQWLREPFTRVALLAWLWLMLGVSPLAINPEKSFLLALPWIRYMLLFIAIRYWLLTTRTALRVLAVMLAVMLALCIIDTLWQYATGMSLTQHPEIISGRLTGPLDKPKIGMLLARYMLPALALLALFAVAAPWRARAVMGLGVLACVVTILLTGERTAFAMSVLSLGVIIGVVVLREQRLRLYALGLVVTVLMSFVLLFYTQPWVQLTLTRTIDHVSHFSTSPYGQVFGAAYDAGRTHWTTGVGMQGLRELTVEPKAGDVATDAVKEHFLHAHNPYLEWFAEAGLVGLLVFMALIGTLLREAVQLLRKTHGMAVMVPAFMLGSLLFNFFPAMSTQSYFSNWTGIMIWSCLAMLFSARALLTADGRLPSTTQGRA
jgi:O-antigen ligase